MHRTHAWALAASFVALCACNREPSSDATTPATPPGQTAQAAANPAAPAAPAAAPAIPRAQLLEEYHKLWYDDVNTWQKNRWLGITTLQNPNDIWITQEIMFETKPDFVVECGAYHGGSAALWAMVLEQINPDARVISIDIADNLAEARKLPIVQKRVDFLIGSSTDPDIVKKVKDMVGGKKAMVILDSDHSKHHVLSEMKLYWELVPVGGYMIVQDTNVNGHPVALTHGPGPWEALDEFMKTNTNFQIDHSRERLLHTLHPRGYLKRIR